MKAVKVRLARHSFCSTAMGMRGHATAEGESKNLHSIVFPAIQPAMHRLTASLSEQELCMAQPIKETLKNILYLISLCWLGKFGV